MPASCPTHGLTAEQHCEALDRARAELREASDAAGIFGSKVLQQTGKHANETRDLRSERDALREAVRALDGAIDHCPVCLASRRAGRLEHGLSCNVGRALAAVPRRGKDPR